MIIYNGVSYFDDELVEWNLAEEEWEFYFSRARYLKLPNPPACFVFFSEVAKVGATARQLKIIKHYDRLFDDAELAEKRNVSKPVLPKDEIMEKKIIAVCNKLAKQKINPDVWLVRIELGCGEFAIINSILEQWKESPKVTPKKSSTTASRIHS